jgi:hypothetical protein
MRLMDWMDKLKEAVPSLALIKAESGKTKLLPREVLAKNIEDSIALLKDADYKITMRGKLVKPEPCFVLRDGKAKITLKYCRQPIQLGADKDTLIVDASEAEAVLSYMKAVVESKEFDGQLGAIKAQRMVQLGKGQKAKKAA